MPQGSLRIKTKLTLGITFFAILLLLAFGAVLFLRMSSRIRADYHETLDIQIRLMDSSIGTYFATIRKSLNLIASLEMMRSPDTDITSYVDKRDPSGLNPMRPLEGSPYEAAVYRLCKQFTEAYPEFLGVSFGLEENGGWVRYPEQDRKNGYDARERSWYKLALGASGQAAFSDAYTTSAGELVVVACRSVSYRDGGLKGVITIDADLEHLGEVMDVVNASGSTKIILTDSKGSVLVHPSDKEAIFKNARELGIAGLAEYTPGSSADFDERTSDGRRNRVLTRPSLNGVLDLNYIIIIPESEYYKNTRQILVLIALWVLLAMLVSPILALLLARIMTGPLGRLTGILRNISEGDGDLTARIPVNARDEIGVLSGYFNKTIEKISGSMQSIIKQASSMKSVGEDLAANMAESASAINQISANIASIRNQVLNQSSGVEETKTTVEQIVKNIELLKASIDSQSASVVESSASIEEMVANIRSVTQILGSNAHTVQELTEAADLGREKVEASVEMTKRIAVDSESLLEASSVIQNIANQTNLLAMNAAIEAAHAGEAGKGFAVVADEIRKLAEDSNSQGKTISSSLQNLKNMIIEVSAGAETIRNQFETIFGLTSTVREQESVIKNAMEEQNSGGTQVLEAIRQINDITGEVKGGSEQMRRGSQEILDEMERLASVTREISQSMTEMTQGVSEISGALQEVNQVAVQNKESVSIVVGELGKFKT